MLYLTKLEISPEAVRNPYDIHRVLWRAFPTQPDAKRTFLFRVNWRRPTVRDARPIEILMQSDIEPVAPPDDDALHILGVRPFSPQLSNGQTLRFMLCGNPVKRLACRGSETGARGDIVPLHAEDDRQDWLERQLNDCAVILESNIVDSRNVFFRAKRDRGKIVTVTFSGILEVADSERLVARLKLGFGRAKSFGCGMLSLAKA
jgi:CRISPR system Cascade subunit CasE